MGLFVENLAAYNLGARSLSRVSRRRCESKEPYQDKDVFRRERGNRGREMRILFRILFNIVLDGPGDFV